MTNANAALDRIGKLAASEVNFTNTIRALDDNGVEDRRGDEPDLPHQGNQHERQVARRGDRGGEAIAGMGVSLDYREDVYRAVKAYADTQSAVEGEEAKLLTETMRDYRRCGSGVAQDAAR
jgi:thimet oligopeptidase